MILENFPAPIRDVITQVASIIPEKTVFLVGGAVRDALCGRQIHDLDFVLNKGAIAAGRRVANALNADFYPLDVERDAGRAIIHLSESERLLIDFTALRGLDLESDLRGRDFTINAIAADIHEPGSYYDPTGGVDDLLHKRLEPCSEFSLLSDPVRILRAARFSADYRLLIMPETIRLIRAALVGLNAVSPERLRDELFRTFQIDSRWTAVRLFEAFGALSLVLPELGALKGLKQPLPHTQDAFEHSIATLKMLHEILNVLGPNHEPEEGTNLTMGLVSLNLGRFRDHVVQHMAQNIQQERTHLALLSMAALYHDAGKAIDQQVNGDGKLTFHAHERTSEKLVRERALFLRLSRTEIEWLGGVVRGHMRPLWLSKPGMDITKRSIYRFFRDYGAAGVDICLLSLADVLATYGPTLPQDNWQQQLSVVRKLFQAYWEMKAEIIAPPLFLNGDEIMGLFELKPGPLIGRLLESLREAQAAGEITHRAEAEKFIENSLAKEK